MLRDDWRRAHHNIHIKKDLTDSARRANLLSFLFRVRAQQPKLASARDDKSVGHEEEEGNRFN